MESRKFAEQAERRLLKALGVAEPGECGPMRQVGQLGAHRQCRGIEIYAS